MSTLIPIPGSVYDPQPVEYAAQTALDIGSGLTRTTSGITTEVDGPFTIIASHSLDLGPHIVGVNLLALQSGPTRLDPAVLSLDRDWETRRAELLQVTVSSATQANSLPARLALDVIKSALQRVTGFVGLQVNAQTVRRSLLALSARREVLDPALAALQSSLFNIYPARHTLAIGDRVERTARTTTDVRNGDSFLILADVLESAIADLGRPNTNGFYPLTDITARLTVAGVEYPIVSFDYQEPAGRLGALLNVRLARPSDLPAVPPNASITFQLVITDADDVERAIALVSNGKIGGRDFGISWRGNGPGDELQISGVDILVDKFGLAPRRPVVMFDPDEVKYEEVLVRPRDAAIDELGHVIMPMLEPVSRLTMLQILQRAYTNRSGFMFMTKLAPLAVAGLVKVASYIGGSGESETIRGLGFGRVITNIADYRVKRADFTIESGWHAGAQPVVGMYSPVYFPIGDDLCIIWAERPLPYGVVPKVVPVSAYQLLALSVPYREPYNAVLLTYQQRTAEYTDVVLRTEVEENTDKGPGQYGEEGYQETLTRTTYQRKYDGTTGAQLAEVVLSNTVETRVALPGSGGILTLVHRETQQDIYANDLKTGHQKVVEGLILTGPDPSTELVTVLQETCEISWVQSPFQPGIMLQARNATRIEGLIFTSSDTQSRLDPVTGETSDSEIKYPALSAQASGVLTDDGVLEFGPLKNITETLRAKGGNQLDVEVKEIDMLTGTVRRSISQPRTGSPAVNSYEMRAKTMMLRDTASEAEIGTRIPVGVNAGELPRDRAIELGKIVLYRGTHPFEGARLNLPGVDFGVGRGSVIQGKYRDGTLTADFLVQGRTITGQNLGQTGHRISMALDGVELPT